MAEIVLPTEIEVAQAPLDGFANFTPPTSVRSRSRTVRQPPSLRFRVFLLPAGRNRTSRRKSARLPSYRRFSRRIHVFAGVVVCALRARVGLENHWLDPG